MFSKRLSCSLHIHKYWMFALVLILNIFLSLFDRSGNQALAMSQTGSSVNKAITEVTSSQIAGLSQQKKGIEIRWNSENYKPNRGFDILRSDSPTGSFTKINSKIITGRTGINLEGGSFSFVDAKGKAGQWYRIDALEFNGTTSQYPAFQARNVMLPTIQSKTSKPLPLHPLGLKNSTTQTSAGKYKFYVSANGIYRITYADLQNANINTANLTGSQAHLSGYGIDIQLATNTPGVLNSSSYFEFYAQANSSPYSNESAYYFSFDGNGLPVVIVNSNSIQTASSSSKDTKRLMRVVKPGFNSIPNTYQATSHFEQDNYYLTQESGDHPFGWDYVFSDVKPSSNFTFTLNSLPSGADSYTVKISGIMAALNNGSNDNNSPEQASFSVNGDTNVVGPTYNWTSYDPQPFSFTFPQSYLHNGDNILTLHVPSTPNCLIILSYFDVSYLRNAVADTDRISASLSSSISNLVSGFSSSNVIGYDITNPFQPQRLSLPAATLLNNNTYGVSLGVNNKSGVPVRTRNRTYYLATASQTGYTNSANPTITALQPDNPINLKDATNAYNMVIISYSGFNLDNNSPAQQLALLHNAHGQKTLVVNQEDVYDNFNNGNPSPKAIKDFLAYAHSNWQTAPKWALMFGTGSEKYREKDCAQSSLATDCGISVQNLLPSHFTVSVEFHTRVAGDNWFVAGADGYTPFMSIGRLPASNLTDAVSAVNNITAYVNTPVSGSWQHQINFIADQYDSDGTTPTNIFNSDSSTISTNLQNALPSGTFTITTYNSGTSNDGVNAFNNGALIVNYLGHGGVQEWSGAGILTDSSIPQLTNGNKRPFVLQLTCFTGQFSLADDNLAWQLLISPNGGSIGSVAASNWTDEGPDVAMGKNFYNSLFPTATPTSSPTIGEATMHTMALMAQNSAYIDEMNDYNLIGDPAIYLNR